MLARLITSNLSLSAWRWLGISRGLGWTMRVSGRWWRRRIRSSLRPGVGTPPCTCVEPTPGSDPSPGQPRCWTSSWMRPGLQLEHEKLLLGLRDRVQLPFFHPCPSGGPFYLQRLVGVLSTRYPGFWAHLVRDQVGYNIILISSLILAIFICRLVQCLRTPGWPHGLLKLL